MARTIVVIAVLLIIGVACGERGKQEGDSYIEQVDSTRLVSVKYSIEGMTCIGCENTVNFAVGELDGVTEVNSSFSGKYAIVTFDTVKVTSEMIEGAVNSKGYTFKGLYNE